MDKEFFLSINEVSKQLNVPAYTLRYWEKQFPGIVRPTTGAGGRRYYKRETLEQLKSIQNLLYNRGMTIAGVKKMLKAGNWAVEATVEKNTSFETMDKSEIQNALELLYQAKSVLEGL